MAGHFLSNFTPDIAVERWVAFRDGYDHYFRWNAYNTRYIVGRVLIFPAIMGYMFYNENRRYNPWNDVRTRLNKEYLEG